MDMYYLPSSKWQRYATCCNHWLSVFREKSSNFFHNVSSKDLLIRNCNCIIDKILMCLICSECIYIYRCVYQTKEVERAGGLIITKNKQWKYHLYVRSKENRGTEKSLSTRYAVSSLVVAFDCEMDSSTIQLSRKRASCMPNRGIQVICSDGILLFLLMHSYPSHLFAFSLSLCVCLS